MRRRGIRSPVAAIIVLLVLIVAAALGLDALFDEAGARATPSLAGALECRSLLVVLAHPDDEIPMAATLAEAARRGCEVRTVTASRGERGIPAGFAGDSASLVRIRTREHRRFGTRLGLSSQTVWSFPDSHFTEVPGDVLRDSVTAAMRRYQPDLVVTLDSICGYTGHPDHRRIGEIVAVAAKRFADDPPVGASRPRWLARLVFPRRLAVFVPDEAQRRRVRAQPRADLAVKGDGRVTGDGMEIHASQSRFFPPRWLRPLLYAFFDREYFAVTRLSENPETAVPPDHRR